MPASGENQPEDVEKLPLLTLIGVFLRLGATAFGGPAAHIAMMEHELVGRRKWLSRGQFLDLLGAANLIPGPNSTELALHIGQLKAGLPGLFAAGICFILPAALMVTAIAELYVRYGKLPQAAALLYGVKPVVVAIVFQALWGLLRAALKNRWLTISALFVGVLYLLGVNVIALLFGAGFLFAVTHFVSSKQKETPVLVGISLVCLAVMAVGIAVSLSSVAHLQFGLPALFWYFLKIGSVLYGSGYVLLAFLRSDLVVNYHWLSAGQLLDATAVGQITPGPVFTTATFIGYILAGIPGAVVATIAIFLPAFVLVALSGRAVRAMRNSELAASFLDAVNAAALALMAVVTMQLARSALVDLPSCLIGISAAVILLRWRVNSVWLILAGAFIGLVINSLLK